MTTTIKKRMTNSGEYLQKVIVWNISMLLTAHGLSQTALTEPLKMTRGGVSAKMKNKNTWSIPDIAALADYFDRHIIFLLFLLHLFDSFSENLRKCKIGDRFYNKIGRAHV